MTLIEFLLARIDEDERIARSFDAFDGAGAARTVRPDVRARPRR